MANAWNLAGIQRIASVSDAVSGAALSENIAVAPSADSTVIVKYRVDLTVATSDTLDLTLNGASASYDYVLQELAGPKFVGSATLIPLVYIGALDYTVGCVMLNVYQSRIVGWHNVGIRGLTYSHVSEFQLDAVHAAITAIKFDTTQHAVGNINVFVIPRMDF